MRNETNSIPGKLFVSSVSLFSWFHGVFLCPRLTLIPKLVGMGEVSGQISLVLEGKGDEFVSKETLSS